METVGKNDCYMFKIISSKNTALQIQNMISDKKLSLFHPVLSKLSVFVFCYRLRKSSSPFIFRYINKIKFRVSRSAQLMSGTDTSGGELLLNSCDTDLKCFSLLLAKMMQFRDKHA